MKRQEKYAEWVSTNEMNHPNWESTTVTVTGADRTWMTPLQAGGFSAIL